MASFSKLTLVQGLEEILTNPKFVEGKDIVSTLHELIAEKRILNQGKVATIISERTFEGEKEEDDEHAVSVSKAERALITEPDPIVDKAVEMSEEATVTENITPEQPTAVVSNRYQLSSEEEQLAVRLQSLPKRYHKILSQLLVNWEKQTKTEQDLRENPPPPDNTNNQGS